MSFVLTALAAEPEQARFEALRQRYFPPERNRVPAHVCLFHQLPDAEFGAIDELLHETVRRCAPCPVENDGPRSIGTGVAFALRSPALSAVHARLAKAWHAWLIPQDRQGFRPHVVVQNKVTGETARATAAEVATLPYPRSFALTALRLWRYVDGDWHTERTYPFSENDVLATEQLRDERHSRT